MLVVVVDVVVVLRDLDGIGWTTDDFEDDDSVDVAYTTVGLRVVELRFTLGILWTTDICSCNGDTEVALNPVPFDDE